MTHRISKRFHNLKSNLNVKPILRLVWRASPRMTVVSLLIITVETTLFFFSLFFLKELIDTIGSNPDHSLSNSDLIYAIIVAAVSGIAYLTFRSISSFTTEAQSFRVSEYINDRIHSKTIDLDLAFYESSDYFDVLNRALNAGTERPTAVINTLFESVKNTLSLFAFGAVLISIDSLLLPILACFVIPTFLVRINFADKYNAWRIKQTPLERQSSYYSELITTETYAKEVRVYGLGHYFKESFMNIRLLLLKEKLEMSKSRTKNEILTGAIAGSGFFACITYIILRPQVISLGDIMLFLVIFPQSFNILQSISSNISNVYYHNIFIKSIFELLSLTPSLKEHLAENKIETEKPVSFEFNNVSFRYPSTEKRVLEDISFRVDARQIIAIVGMNGAGKTTLVKLICRLYDADEGQVFLDENDIATYASDEYRKQIGIVFQDFAKYQVSAADNIRFGNISKHPDMDAIQAAAVKSGADKFIKDFPDRYDNMMGKLFENGQEVSIGQWQKLANARCLYSDARLLIFDEATSALDAQAEKEFFDDFRKNIGNRAAIIISHRHSAVKNADHIYVLSQGKICQSGTDEKLLSEEGDYATLFKKKVLIDVT